MAGTIHRANQVDVSNFSFGDIVVNKYGGKSSRVKYNGEDFYFQTPRMRLPYGLGCYEEKDGDGNILKKKFSLDFSFAGYEETDTGEASNPKVRDLFSMMEGLQDLLVATAIENSESWLGIDDADESAAKVLTRPVLKFARDKVTKKITHKYAPTFKAKVGYWDGRFSVNAFNEKKEEITDLPKECPKGTQGVAIIRLSNVTFAGGKCGYSFQVYQIKLYRPVSMPSYAFLDDGDDDVPVTTGDTPAETSTSPEHHTSNKPTLVPDSDDDESNDDSLDMDDESEEELAPPSPVKVKKTLKKPRKRKTKSAS